jgi:hypothetical protein
MKLVSYSISENEYIMYKGWAFLALAPRPTVVYCAYRGRWRLRVLDEVSVDRWLADPKGPNWGRSSPPFLH